LQTRAQLGRAESQEELVNTRTIAIIALIVAVVLVIVLFVI